MSNNEVNDYRGRGKNVSRKYQPRHSAGNAAGNLQPIDAAAAAGAASGAGVPGVVPDAQQEVKDPFGAPVAEPAVKAKHSVESSEPVAEPAAEPVVEADAEPVAAEPVVEQAAAEPAAEAAPEPEAAVDDPFAPQTEADPELAKYMRGNAEYEHRSGFSHGQKVALVIVLIVAIIAAIIGGLAFGTWQNAQKQIALDEKTSQEIAGELSQPVSTEPFWTLVLGSDQRDDEVSRSDVFMLVRADLVNKKLTMVSIPRDSKIYLDGVGTSKINAAYATGGAVKAIQVAEAYTGVQISHYVEVYFEGVVDLVDQLGGVEVDVPEYCSYKGVTLQPGVQVLDGKQALTFARCRKTYSEGDFTRTKCQRILLQAILDKFLQQDPTNYANTISALAGCFSTDIQLTDLASMATAMQGISKSNIYSAMAPSTTGMIDGVSYTFTYINQWKLLMQRAIAGEDPTVTEEEAAICGTDTTEYSDLDMTVGLPEEVQAALQQYWDEEAEKAAAASTESSTDASTSNDGQ